MPLVRFFLIFLSMAAASGGEVQIVLGDPQGRVGTDPDSTSRSPCRSAVTGGCTASSTPAAIGCSASRPGPAGRRSPSPASHVVTTRVTPESNEWSAAAFVFHGLYDVAVAPDGLVYVADTFHGRIRAFDPTTRTVAAAGYGGDDGPAAGDAGRPSVPGSR